MSHYCMAVFSNSNDDSEFYRLLAPFDENNKQNCVFRPEPPHIIEMKRRNYSGYLLNLAIQLIEKNQMFSDKQPQSFNQFMESQGYVESDRQWGYMHNPNARWDWYTLGGRDYIYNLKPETVARRENGEGEDGNFYRLQDYDYDSDDIPYCFLTPDGVMHAPGKVGWFATDDSTQESWAAYEKEWKDYIGSGVNPYVSFVDCHI